MLIINSQIIINSECLLYFYTVAKTQNLDGMGYNLNDKRQGLADTFESGLVSGSMQYFDTHEFIEIIDFFLDQNETLKAERAIKNALNQHPYSISLQIRKADWLFETNMYEDAEELIDDVLEVEINNSEANELKADLLIQKENQVEGILYLQKALLFSEDKIELYSKIGIELMELNKYEIALQFFLKVLDESIHDESSLYNSSYCYELLNKQEEAIVFFHKYIDKNPYSQIAWHQLGIQYKALGNYKKAIWAFDYATVVDDAFLGAFFEKAKCHEELEEYTEAITIYKNGQKMADPTAWAYYRLGEVYNKLQDTEQAIIHYFKAIHEDPMYGEAWHRIAFSYINNSQAERALEYAERAVEIEYDNVEFNSLLARAYMHLSKFEKADHVYENLISLEVDDANIWIEYAVLLKTLGAENDALDLLLRSVGYFSDNAEILYRLTGCLFVIDRDIEAIDFLREALRIDFKKKDILKLNYPIIYHSEIVQDMIFAHKHHDKFF